MLSEPAEGLETPRSSTEVVSKVLSQTSAATTFLKNAGLETPGSKSAVASAREAQLREQLQAEKTRADLLEQELDTLKKKGEETEQTLSKTQEAVLRTQQEMEEFKKRQEESYLAHLFLCLLGSSCSALVVASGLCWLSSSLVNLFTFDPELVCELVVPMR